MMGWTSVLTSRPLCLHGEDAARRQRLQVGGTQPRIPNPSDSNRLEPLQPHGLWDWCPLQWRPEQFTTPPRGVPSHRRPLLPPVLRAAVATHTTGWHRPHGDAQVHGYHRQPMPPKRARLGLPSVLGAWVSRARMALVGPPTVLILACSILLLVPCTCQLVAFAESPLASLDPFIVVSFSLVVAPWVLLGTSLLSLSLKCCGGGVGRSVRPLGLGLRNL